MREPLRNKLLHLFIYNQFSCHINLINLSFKQEFFMNNLGAYPSLFEIFFIYSIALVQYFSDYPNFISLLCNKQYPGYWTPYHYGKTGILPGKPRSCGQKSKNNSTVFEPQCRKNRRLDYSSKSKNFAGRLRA